MGRVLRLAGHFRACLLLLPPLAFASPAAADTHEVRATVLPAVQDLQGEILDLLFDLRTAEEARLLLRREALAEAIRADTLLLRVIHDRFVHPWVSETTGKSLEELERLFQQVLRSRGRTPRGVRLADIPLLPIPRLDAVSRSAPPPPRAEAPSPAVPSPPHTDITPLPPAPSPPPMIPGRWTPWGWVHERPAPVLSSP